MKKLSVGLVLMLAVQSYAVPVAAQMNNSRRAADCSTYARNLAESEISGGAGMLRGSARGAVGGAVFGAITGGRKGAKRGAALGAGLGGVKGGVQADRERQARYHYYYDACMRGDRY